MTAKKPKIFLGEGVERIYDLEPQEKNYFIYNSTHDSGMSAEVTFYAAQNEEESVQASIESDLRQGEKLKARYWPVQSTEGLGQEVYLEAEIDPRAKSNSSHVVFEQVFSRKDIKGKYVVEVANPWEFKVKFQIFMRPYHVERDDIDLYWTWRGPDSFQNPDPKLHTISMIKPGILYLWAYSCGPTLDLKIENGDIETEMVTISKGEGYSFHENIEKNSVIEVDPNNEEEMHEFPGTPTYKSVLVSKNSNSSNEGHFILFLWTGNEKKIYNYDLREDHLAVDLTFERQKDERSDVNLEFKPIEFRDPKTYSPSIGYDIWFCPDGAELALESSLCNNLHSDRCIYSYRKSLKDQKELVKGVFYNIDDGLYTVKVTAKVQYHSGFIKVFQPYDVGYVNVNKPIFWKIFWKVFIGIAIFVVVIVVGWIGYKKFNMRQGNNRLGLQRIENTMKGFSPLDEVSREPKNKVIPEKQKTEESECGVVEKNDEEE